MSEHFHKIIESDIESIVAIENESHIHPWSKNVFRDCLRVSYVCEKLVCESNNKIMVYGIMSVAAGEAHIFNVCVNNEFRRQGNGTKMMLHLIEKAQAKNAAVFFLEVRPSNIPAISLYEKLGFDIVGRRKEYYPADSSESGREDAIIMSMSST